MTQTATQEPVEIVSTTPSGIDVLYSPSPRRLYKVRAPKGKFLTNFQDVSEWNEVASVTTVLGILDKSGPLIWWGQGVACEGVTELVRRGLLTINSAGQLADAAGGEVTKEDIVAFLVAEKLSTNHVRDKAGDRGVAVHNVLETWADGGKLPDSDLFPDEQRGYVVGLYEFLKHLPSAEPVASEVMVGSVEHGFAGRYDIRFRTTEPHEVVVRRTPKRGPQWATVAPGLLLADLKSSKGIYATHALQLAAYELASIECGYGATDGRGILHVSADGTYEFRRAKATAEDFLAVLAVHQRFAGSKEWIK